MGRLEDDRPTCRLLGEDANVYSIVARVSRTLRRVGHDDRATEFVARVKACGSYDEAISIALEYVNAEWRE